MEKITLTRKELYDLVWHEPMLTVSKKYNISDTGLRKICVKMAIPVPKSGHWQKIQHGKQVAVEPLPLEYSGEQEITLFLKQEGDQANLNLLSPLSILQNEIENDPNLILTVSDRLTNPDKLIIAAKNSLTGKDARSYDGWVSCSRGELDIRVAPGNVARALRFMDTFIKLLRARGHEIKLRNDTLYAIIEEEEISMSFREKRKKVSVQNPQYSWRDTEYHPTGILSFQIEIWWSKTEWKDGKLPIESQLSRILATIELKGKERKERRLIREKERAEEEERKHIQRELEKRKEKELSDFKELLREAHRWRQVKVLRSYIVEVEAKATTENIVSDELKSWLEWAHKKIDWYDPYIEAEDELLKEVDRENLTFKKSSGY